MLTKKQKSRIAKRNRERSYSNEKAAEQLFHGFRIGTMGKEDVMHNTFSVEAKTYQDPPKSIQSWMGQAIRNAPENRVPIVYLHKLRQRREQDWVIMRVCDFLEMFAKILEEGDPKK